MNFVHLFFAYARTFYLESYSAKHLVLSRYFGHNSPVSGRKKRHYPSTTAILDKGDLYSYSGGGNPETPYSRFAISRGKQAIPIKRNPLPLSCIFFTELNLLKPYVNFFRATHQDPTATSMTSAASRWIELPRSNSVAICVF
jgi:hypothetical protein